MFEDYFVSEVLFQFTNQGWYIPSKFETSLVPRSLVGFGIGVVGILGFYFIGNYLLLLLREKKDQRQRKFFFENDIYEDDIEENYWKLLEKIRQNNNITNTNEPQYIFDKQWQNLQKYLFNVEEDPEEKKDLTKKLPKILEELRQKTREFYGSFTPRDYPSLSQKGDPKNFDGIWSSGQC